MGRRRAEAHDYDGVAKDLQRDLSIVVAPPARPAEPPEPATPHECRESKPVATKAKRYKVTQDEDVTLARFVLGLQEASGTKVNLALLNRVSKRLVEAIDQYDAAGRDDLAEKERAQLAIVKDYLPAELSDEDLAVLVAEVVAEVGAETPKDMGKVMPVLLPRVAGRADGKRVSTAVKAALQG